MYMARSASLRSAISPDKSDRLSSAWTGRLVVKHDGLLSAAGIIQPDIRLATVPVPVALWL
jgi:hypothetical protein